MSSFKSTKAGIQKPGNSKKEAQINALFSKITKGLMTIYVLFYLCIFPLCMNDRYFDILKFRFELFWKPTLAYGIIFLLIGLFYLLCDTLYNGGAVRSSFLRNFRKEGEKNKSQNRLWKRIKFGSTDTAMTVLIVCIVLSTVFAEYPYEAFWGDRGRFQGLLLWLMFYIAYWLVTRFYSFKKWHLYAFMSFASVVCIWGICNFFLITFGMFRDADSIYRYTFVSSIGNINTYSCFTGMLFGFSTASFIKAEKLTETIYSYIVLCISCFAQIMGLSDCALLSTLIVIAVAPFALCENWKQVSKLFVSVSTYICSMKVVALIIEKGIPTMNDMDPSLQITLAGKQGFTVLLMAVLVMTLLVSAYAFRKNGQDAGRSIAAFKKIILTLIVIAASGVIAVLVLANTGWHSELWEPYRNILIFNDSWGTDRGLVWRLAMEYWTKDATLLAKIFGYGPDTFYIITMDRFMGIMQDAGRGMFDSAHNEYLEYFVTIGIAGLAAYLYLICTSVKTMLKGKYSKYCMLAVAAYAFQAVVNIAIPIVTPVYMLLMFAGIRISEKEHKI
ncbi:O-antigen ligase family protein [Oribacterium sp. WCC10]|uniref:O-antigen ligase family protein n=1 Tax=Oribacterium sp. WCC10 TaxID=1855343 RepID=UPI0008F3C40E|nr:O-antigen ligase family protein [Oribacterium sp. WCC10]SFG36513.1 hypothetical protein SAMN05216356_106171 [Oribacterium sp. WCC10]